MRASKLKASPQNTSTVTIDSCHLNGSSIHSKDKFALSMRLNFNEIKVTFSEKPPARLRDWFLNGPTQKNIIDSVDQPLLHQCTKEHFLIKEPIDYSNYKGPACYSHYYMWGNVVDYRFLLAIVPIEGPDWSTNVQIEYQKDWGKIPDKNERLKIEELCSFIFGKHLLSLGYTIYDSKESVVAVSAHNPWGKNAKASCSQPEYPPVRFHDFPPGGSEYVLNKLLPNYLSQSIPLNLSGALWNFWMSFDVPIGINLAIISSSIETIIENWFKTNRSVSRGLLLEPAVFNQLTNDLLLTLELKLQGLENGEKVLDAIRRSNAYGIMESYRVFFKEIGLNIRSAEWEAIHGRSHFVHGPC